MRIILTGGGTAGHVNPNLALLPLLKQGGFEPHYIGSWAGIEAELVRGEGIPYYAISSGKLRRYLSMSNVTDAFRVMKGVGQAMGHIKRIKPDIIFSKGGFVAVPVVLAGKILKVPIVIHESDMSMGLANKLCAPWADKICLAFPEALSALPKPRQSKAAVVGTPIRAELLAGDRAKGLALCGFNSGKPVLLVMGGSLGARAINAAVIAALDGLLKEFQVVHIVGKGNLANINKAGYKQFEYLIQDLPHALAAADIVVSRAGANAIAELLTLKKPSLLIPLPLSQSRGDQLQNAKSFEKSGYSIVMQEEGLTPQSLTERAAKLYKQRHELVTNMRKSPNSNGAQEIMKILEALV